MREMKDSGVAWIGEIPKEWEISLINTLYTVRNTKVSDVDYQPLSVTMKGIVPQLSTAAKTNAHDDRKLVKKGDFAINSRSDRRGSCGISDYDGSVSLINTVLSPRNEMNPIYYSWLFHSSEFADEFYRWGHGIVDDLWTTRWQEMRNISIPVPPLSIQHQIATYLDKKCTQIDALIANQQKQIEKLKAYKQSLITETVTKGLNPDVPMKDSGVEWIGEIPEDWEISKVGLFYEILLGKMLQPNSKGNDTLEKYLCATNVGGNKLSFNTVKEMWFSKSEKEQYLLKKGDLLVVEGGDVASSAIIEFDIDNIYYQNALHRVRAKKGLNEFLRYWLMSAKGLGYFDMICNKATIAHFTKDKFSFLPLVVLSLEEQQAMVSYLDQKCTQIDSLIAIKQRKIEKLQQYKKSVIYEYVTGKKEVK